MNSPAMLLTDDDLTRALAQLGSVAGDAASGFGTLSTSQGGLPLKALSVQARIDGLLARVELAQTYVNTADVALEATYVFPLPDRAAVTAFRMEVAGRTVSGVLQERGEARAAYQKAIATGHRAALAEEERPDVFTLQVGNLMPGESATVHLVLAEILPYADGEATFRFPLVVAPRYIPGTPLPGPAVGRGTAEDTDAVPDASRISPPVLLPGWPSPVELAIEVELCGGPLGVSDIRSSLHGVWLEEGQSNGDGVHRLRVLPGHKLDRDFVLRYRLAGDQIRTSLSLHPDSGAPKPGGTFALTLVPPREVSDAVLVRPRRIAFVLDRSGSMEGWKMVAARRAVEQMVATLRPSDAFTVLAFDTSIETPWGNDTSARPASARSIAKAREFLSHIDARGGTELDGAIGAAIAALADDTEGRDRLVILVTDGQVGDEHRLLKRVGDERRSIRFFSVGIDQAVNAGLLRRLSEMTGGACELVESEARLEERMEAIHRLIARPLLSFEKLEPIDKGLKLDASCFVPRRSPDLFPGSPVLLLGRYEGEPRGNVRLRATGPDAAAWSTEITPRVTANPAVSAAWARGRVRLLEDDYVVAPDVKKRQVIESELVALSLAHGVLCRFTAYVAIDAAEVVNAGGRVLSITQAVETPAGWSAAGIALGGVLSSNKNLAFEQLDSFLACSAPEPSILRHLSRPSRTAPKKAAKGPSCPADSLGRSPEPPAPDLDLSMPSSLTLDDESTLLCAPLRPPTGRLPERAEPGNTEGRFVHQRPIGLGGFVTRYQAFDRDRGIEVEIEIMTGDDQARWAWAEMYRLEAAVSQELNHPGIVPLLDVIAEAGRLTIVRPLLPERFTAPGPLDPAEAARMVAELAEIVEYVHVYGKLLRGLASDEIRVSPDGHVFLEGGAVHAGGPQEVTGSLALIAPERLTSPRRRRMSADVYSLGALLYRWLTGRTVLVDKSGKTPSLTESVALLNSGTWAPTPPRRINRKIPAALEAICLRAIALEPEKRPASAGALAAELRAVLPPAKSDSAERRKGFWK